MRWPILRSGAKRSGTVPVYLSGSTATRLKSGGILLDVFARVHEPLGDHAREGRADRGVARGASSRCRASPRAARPRPRRRAGRRGRSRPAPRPCASGPDADRGRRRRRPSGTPRHCGGCAHCRRRGRRSAPRGRAFRSARARTSPTRPRTRSALTSASSETRPSLARRSAASLAPTVARARASDCWDESEIGLGLLHRQLELAGVVLGQHLAPRHRVAEVDEQARDGPRLLGAHLRVVPGEEAAHRLDRALDLARLGLRHRDRQRLDGAGRRLRGILRGRARTAHPIALHRSPRSASSTSAMGPRQDAHRVASLPEGRPASRPPGSSLRRQHETGS